MPIVKVEAPEQANTYDIHIGHGLLKKAAGLLERCRGHRAMIVTDENVAPLYLDAMKAQLEAAGWGEALGVTPAGTGARIERVLRAYGLPTERDERLTRAHLAAVMALDKKAEGDGVRCVLLTKIGACTGTVIRGAQLEALL